MAYELTKQQKQAVEAEGTVLVAAAAGSGKTAVLVERIMRRFCDENNPLMADRALVVTFTNAAAAELKTKIEDKLRAALDEQPDNVLLQKQNLLIKNATIGTIDSFCISLFRDNYYYLGIPRDFKIADPSVVPLTEDRIIDGMFKEKYTETDAAFAKALQSARQGYDDSFLKQIILTVYRKGTAMPYQNEWYDSLAEAYCGDGELWKSVIFENVADLARDALSRLAALLEIGENEPAFSGYVDTTRNAIGDCETVLKLCAVHDWDGILNFATQVKMPKYVKSKKIPQNICRMIDSVKTRFAALQKEIEVTFAYNEDTCSAIMSEFGDTVGAVIELVKEYDNRIWQFAYDNKQFTFAQIEHLALKLLVLDGGRAADAFRQEYDAILVDEYQDNSNLQDELFAILNNGLDNLFTVGDVKQSIYGFRNANPDNFLVKQNTYADYGTGENPSKVMLTGNFRSRKEICKFVNYIFTAFMSKESADIDYGDSEALDPMASYPENAEDAVEVCYISSDEMKTYEAEAEVIADKVVEILQKPPFLSDDNGGLRKAEYGDIVLLMRSPKNKINYYVSAFQKRGIPVNAPAVKFCESPEIITAVSMLKVIDNTNDAISLLSFIKSPLFGITDDDIAEISLNGGNLFYNLSVAAESNAECKRAVDFIAYAKALSSTLTVDELLTELYKKLSFGEIFSAVLNRQCSENLLLLSQLSAGYGSVMGKTIGDFIAYMESDAVAKISATTATSANAVRIMSFHTSKGLQFPVCFICGLTAKFNMQDTVAPIVCDDSAGLAFNYYSTKYRSVLAPVTKKFISLKIRQKQYKEELRLLYVALTRAKEKLVLFITAKDTEKYLSTIGEGCVGFEGALPFPAAMLGNGKSYADWLTTAVLCHTDGAPLATKNAPFYCDYPCKFTVSRLVLHGAAIERAEAVGAECPKITTHFDYVYPYSELSTVPAKTSVTDILRKNRNTALSFMSRPSFLSKQGLTPAERGTATHLFMEACNFGAAAVNIECEIERLKEWEYITAAQADAIDRDAVAAFFDDDIYCTVKSAKNVYKEYRFLTKLSACRFNDRIAENSEEYALVQGVADCVLEFDDSICIIDYKTDRNVTPADLRREYSGQLAIYAEALSKIFAKPVSKKLIYSFTLKASVEI